MGDKKVDFIVCGAQKAGTTALYEYLKSYPEISMSKQKEIHFFDNELLFSNTDHPNYSYYHSYFECSNRKTLWGEVTPIYMYWHDAPRRMWEYNPNLRIILILRNPIDRAYSHWNMEFSKGKDTLNFGEAIRQEDSRVKEALPLQHRVYSYIDRGCYMRQIQRLWEYFPKEQVLILKYDELLNEPRSALRRVESFLVLQKLSDYGEVREHVSSYKEEMALEDFDYLSGLFGMEIKQIEHYLKWDCSDWV